MSVILAFDVLIVTLCLEWGIDVGQYLLLCIVAELDKILNQSTIENGKR